MACAQGCRGIVEHLLAYGADVHLQNNVSENNNLLILRTMEVVYGIPNLIIIPNLPCTNKNS